MSSSITVGRQGIIISLAFRLLLHNLKVICEKLTVLELKIFDSVC